MKKEPFNPWPYGLVLSLVLFCTIQFCLVVLASTGFEGLDDVEYYRHGVEYGKEIDRQERQQDLGWTVSHNLGQAQTPNQEFPLRIALRDYDQKPIQHVKLKAKIGRPATIREDKTYEFKEVGPGIYACDVDLGAGNWKIMLEAEKGESLVKVEIRHGVGSIPASPVSGPR